MVITEEDSDIKITALNEDELEVKEGLVKSTGENFLTWRQKVIRFFKDLFS